MHLGSVGVAKPVIASGSLPPNTYSITSGMASDAFGAAGHAARFGVRSALRRAPSAPLDILNHAN